MKAQHSVSAIGDIALLADASACLRYLVLRELLQRSDDDPEVQELKMLRLTDPTIAALLRAQQPDGSWPSTVLAGTAGAREGPS